LSLPLWEIAVKIDRAHCCRRLDGRILIVVYRSRPVANTDDNQPQILQELHKEAEAQHRSVGKVSLKHVLGLTTWKI
jgi:hypothetical protein